ncbi:MAG: hypothetical protein ABIT09_12900 [Croceibacterium sp.]
MKDAVDIFLQIVLAIFGAVFFGSVFVALAAFMVGCLIFGAGWTWLGWHRRREARRKERP